MTAYPAELYPGCPCYTCDQKGRIDAARAQGRYAYPTRMSLCPRCGSKRCRGAGNHVHACTTPAAEAE